MAETLIERYISYVKNVRRYSARTGEVYSDVLRRFAESVGAAESVAAAESVGAADGDRERNRKTGAADDALLLESLVPQVIRGYEVQLLDGMKECPRTVNLHLSVISGFCRWLVKKGLLQSNPVRILTRPKVEKRLPSFCREESMNEYFSSTESDASEETLSLILGHDRTSEQAYSRRLSRLIISILYNSGIRRAELIGLRIGDVDFSRSTMKVRGKGDKVREIPLISSLCKEISLYLQSVETMEGRKRSADEPLAVTPKGSKLYPMFIERVTKSSLGQVGSITGRKSPHVLRHSLATGLLDEGADLNSIKELLGHSSLAATQVYTHNSIEKLKKVYVNAHPRAKSGGKNGD